MEEKTHKKTVIIVFDAVPFEQIKKINVNDLSYFKLNKISKLESIIGYSSGIFPSIWTGKYPDTLDNWFEFKFISKMNKVISNKNSENLNIFLRILPYFPSYLSKIISAFIFLLKSRFRLPFGYPYPSFFDFKMKHLFFFEDYHKYIFYNRNEQKCYKTIFSILDEQNRTFKQIDTNQLIDNFSTYSEDVIFYYNSIMDFLGHKFGPNSSKYHENLLKITYWLDNLLSNKDYNVIIFSDHGMAEVKRKFYPLRVIKELKLRLNKDIIVWLDSTMIKIWFISQKSKNKRIEIISKFNLTKKGHFLTKEEKNRYGLNFKNRYFGDLIFIVDPYFEVFPNFFNMVPFRITAGLHGYVPTHKSSYGIFYSNLLKYEKEMKIMDIFDIIIKILELD